MNNPKISVIVPVYNVEKYLSRCIESVLAQTFTDFELLLIDDGSTDSSGKICDKYAMSDSRIRVFHKENGGVASARQLGVDKAKGVYSIHTDSDDWVEPNMLEEMYLKILETRADMVIADFYSDVDNQVRYIQQRTNKIKSAEILNEILVSKLFGALWNKLIRHSLYRDYSVRFIPCINCCEDVLVLVQLLLLNIKVTFLHEAFYHYDSQNSNSITRNFKRSTFLTQCLYVEALKELLLGKYKMSVEFVAFQLKIGAFYHGVITEKEFYHYMPPSLRTVLFCKCSNKWKLRMLLTYLGLYCRLKRNWIKYKKNR